MQPQAYIGVMSPSAHSEDEYQGGGGDFHDMSGQEESQSGPIRDWKEKQRDPKWDKS